MHLVAVAQPYLAITLHYTAIEAPECLRSTASLRSEVGNLPTLSLHSRCKATKANKAP